MEGAPIHEEGAPVDVALKEINKGLARLDWVQSSNGNPEDVAVVLRMIEELKQKTAELEVKLRILSETER